MAPLWERLGELQMPVHVLAGERDQKFLRDRRGAWRALPDGGLLVVAGGHGLPLENPPVRVRRRRLGAGLSG